MIDIEYDDPSTYLIAGSVLLCSLMTVYNIYSCYCRERDESEIELTTNVVQDNFQHTNEEMETQTDIESQQRTTQTQTEDLEFYNVMGNQIDKYIKNKRHQQVFEYESDD